jgi:predicted lipoprotein with Yx(FWY)xxD motif
VVVATTTGPLGTYLVDGQGRTLYLFESDANGTSSCTGGCAKTWPPLISTGKPTAGTGADAGKLITITRPDGTKQVVYGTFPLYTNQQDTAAGQTNGQGSGGKWWIVGVDGKPIKTAAGSPAPSSKTSG